MKVFATMSATILVLVACNAIEQDVVPKTNGLEGQEVIITASSVPETKTVLDDDYLTVLWKPAEEIKVFSAGEDSKFISQNNTASSVVQFKGTIPVITGVSEGVDYDNYIYGLYPYNENATLSNGVITTTLPSTQTAVPDSFDDDLFITIGKSETLSMGFYNVCSGLRFSFSEGGYTSVTLSSNNGEALAGVFSVGFDDNGKPAIQSVSSPSNSITVNAPAGGFQGNTWYYVICLPGTFSSGITLSVTNGSVTGTYTIDSSLTFNRGSFKQVSGLDTKMTWSSAGTIPPGAVDLGLSVYWATSNLNTSGLCTNPHDYGDYYAWGETEPYYEEGHSQDNPCSSWRTRTGHPFPIVGYDWASYKWCNGGPSSLTKYTSYGGDFSNYDYEDDAARIKLGGMWRMPTDAEWTELRKNCTWTWTDNYSGTGVAGRIVTSNVDGYKDKSIFFPASGYRSYADLYSVGSSGCYWSSSQSLITSLFACVVYFNSSEVTGPESDRCYGRSVRPVIYNDSFTHVTGISLSASSEQLAIGETLQLSTTVTPTNATNPAVTWSSSNASVASVNTDGFVEALAAGTATITVKTNDGGYTASCEVTVPPSIPVPETVDLGLSVKWASFNIGASKPEEYGDYYAWGETEPKSYYAWSTYKWSNNGSSISFTKYNTKSSYGTADNKTALDPEDDVAHVKLADKWRMPTAAEWDELRSNCTWTPTVHNGVDGYEVKRNANSIFLPAAGQYKTNVGSYGWYWSLSLKKDNPSAAIGMFFDPDPSDSEYDTGGFYRSDGLPVRPVYGDFIKVTGVSLSAYSAQLQIGEILQLNATTTPANASNPDIVWYSSNTSVAYVNSNGLLEGVALGTATITAKTCDGGYTASCKVTVYASSTTPEGAVDLGLSVKWASCNLGAAKPNEYGNYYAWGETEPKSDYSWSTYKFGTSYSGPFSKYGTVDNKTVLEPEDDVAHVKLGGKWRMPTKVEFDELRFDCWWTWTDNYNETGVAGLIVTSNKNGYKNKRIFLPAAGNRYGTNLSYVGSIGNYWSSSLGTSMEFYFDSEDAYFDNVSSSRCKGLSVRPVSE